MSTQPSTARPLHLSFSAKRGGAGIAAWRLHHALRNEGATSCMLVSETCGYSSQDGVIGPQNHATLLLQRLRKNLEIHLVRLAKKPKSLFSPAWFGPNLERQIHSVRPNVLHCHWINYAHASLQTIARAKLPVVWTLHDMWPFTGGCHYSGPCERFRDSCGQCPILGSQDPVDLATRVQERKASAYRLAHLSIVAPSRWLAEQAKSSSLLRDCRVSVIPYGIDTQLYRPIDRRDARKQLGLDPDGQCILFASVNAASDPRKGGALLFSALERLKALASPSATCKLIVAGATQSALPTDLPFPATALGHVDSESRMAKIYAAADVFAAPSLQDNLPNTVLESLSCGTPVAAFAAGGIPDAVEDGKNGKLAHSKDAESLANSLHWIIEDKRRHECLSQSARATATSRFCSSIQAKAYLELYQGLLHSA